MTFNLNDNVIFDIFAETYVAAKHLKVISDTAEVESLHGHLQDSMQSLQGIREIVNPNEKPTKYKLVVRSTPLVDKYLSEGRIVRVTKTRNKYTKAWRRLNTVRDYRIVKINDLDANGLYIVVSLQDQGSDAPRQ